jgi:hypothetical protein
MTARGFLPNIAILSTIMAVAALIEADRVLGTYTPSDRAESVVYGLDEVDPARIGSFGRFWRCHLSRAAGTLHKSQERTGPYTVNIPA